jgi:hypothetical protein
VACPPAPANATATCTNKTCDFTCDGGYTACGDGTCGRGPGTSCQTSAECCGELVCGGPSVNTSQWVCHPNHAPVVFDVDIRNNWKFECTSVTLRAFDPDPDFRGFIGQDPMPLFLIVTPPEHGFISGTSDIAVDDGSPGPPALPAPPLPAGTPTDCLPRCAWSNSGRVTQECEAGPVCPGCVASYTGWGECPEGSYLTAVACYQPFMTDFTGTDSFTYRAIDRFGAKGPVATVTLTIFEV